MSAPSDLHRPAPIADYLRAPDQLRADAVWCGLAPASCDLLVQAASELLRRPERLADLARCAAALFGPDEWKGADWQDTPRDASPGEQFFLMLPLLQHLPVTRAAYARRAIPESVLRETLADLQLWVDTQVERTGQAGFREAGWLREHFGLRVIRLGRLQFQPATYAAPFTVLVHRRTGETRLAAHAGRSITAGGVFADSEGATGPFIELTCEERDGEIRRAHLVRPDGRIAAEPAALEPGGWDKRLTTGDAVLALHIPAGAPLAFEACRDSFQRADAFYPRYFADQPAPRGVVCGSWLFNPDLSDLLPPESNIVRFQQAFHRHPLPGANAGQTYERAFSPFGRAIPREQLKGTLQHRLFEHIQAGHIPLGAGGLVLAPLNTFGVKS